MDKQGTSLVLESVVVHLQGALDTAGWTTPSNWVIVGNEIDPDSDPPVVAVHIPNTFKLHFETGSTTKEGEYRIEILAHGDSDSQMDDLKDTIEDNLHGINIIDFNTAMPGDVGYDAVAQKLANGRVSGSIRSSVVNKEENITRIVFELRPDGPLT